VNLGELKTLILSTGHRTELTVEVAGFVLQAEERIAREVRAREMIVISQLTDANRVTPAEGIYNLPDGFTAERAFYVPGQFNSLTKKGLGQLRNLSGGAAVSWYCLRGGPTLGGQVEFRGVPGVGTVIDLVHFGRLAALTSDAATNALLTNHSALYLQGGLIALHQWSENLELAQVAENLFNVARDAVNEQVGEYIGGTDIAPSQNLGVLCGGGGYD
jgi:hypothetical protein